MPDDLTVAQTGHLSDEPGLVTLGVDGNRGSFQQLGYPDDVGAHHGTTHVVRVVVGGQRTGAKHVIGRQDVEDAVDVIGRVNHYGLAGLPITDEVDEVDHLAGHRILGGEVPAGQELAEVEALGSLGLGGVGHRRARLGGRFGRVRAGGPPDGLGQSQNLTERTTGCRGHTGRIIMFGLGPTGGHLDRDRVSVDYHFTHGPSCRPPLDGVGPYAERSRLRRQHLGNHGHCGRIAQSAHHMGRAALLHHDRRDPGIVGARFEALGDGVGEGLAGGVVDVHLQLHQCLARTRRSGRRVDRRAHDDLEKIRAALQVTVTCPVSGHLDDHGGHVAPVHDQGRQEGRTGRRGELERYVGAMGGRSSEERDGCRRRYRNQPVR